MRYYETVILFRQDITTEQAEFLTARSAKIITDNGGKTIKAEYWGLRNLAYKINKNKKAHYVMLQTETEHAAIAEMERLMKINEDILRHLTFVVDEVNAEDSVIMRESNGSRLLDLSVQEEPSVKENATDTPAAYNQEAN